MKNFFYIWTWPISIVIRYPEHIAWYSFLTNPYKGIKKGRSEKLLLNILPEETGMELKQKGKVKAEKLVESVGFYFSKFDEIMEKYKLEKIKTIGDS